MMRIDTDVAVIGAGPAGLSAATEAAKAGARVHVLDGGAAPGGQYWMRDFSPGRAGNGQSGEGVAAAEGARSAGVHLHQQTEVWAVTPDLRIFARRGDEALEVAARAIIIATGAHDRVMPFPGWTLPGVMTPGAGQRLAKLGGVAPGQRIAIAGSGPFLLAVARTLETLGVRPVALLEARRPDAAVLAHMLRHPSRWREAAALLATARRIPLRRTGWAAIEAIGRERVEAVRVAPVDRNGRIDAQGAQTIPDIDALLIGWGFVPSIDVSAVLRCRHAFDHASGGWHCVAEPATGRTSVPDVYAAGEVTGIAGALPARLSGALAGLDAAAALGFASASRPRRSAMVARLDRFRRFADGLNRLYAPPAGLAGLVAPGTIVCRCEEVTASEIDAALGDGASDVQGAKRWTRAGMGRCQGRICGWAVAELTARAAGSRAEAAGFNPARIPLRPVPLDVVLDALGGPSL